METERNSLMIPAAEMARILGCGLSKAYQICAEHNAKLAEQGYITLRGKLPRAYFFEKIYGGCGK